VTVMVPESFSASTTTSSKVALLSCAPAR